MTELQQLKEALKVLKAQHITESTIDPDIKDAYSELKTGINSMLEYSKSNVKNWRDFLEFLHDFQDSIGDLINEVSDTEDSSDVPVSIKGFFKDNLL